MGEPHPLLFKFAIFKNYYIDGQEFIVSVSILLLNLNEFIFPKVFYESISPLNSLPFIGYFYLFKATKSFIKMMI